MHYEVRVSCFRIWKQLNFDFFVVGQNYANEVMLLGGPIVMQISCINCVCMSHWTCRTSYVGSGRHCSHM